MSSCVLTPTSAVRARYERLRNAGLLAYFRALPQGNVLWVDPVHRINRVYHTGGRSLGNRFGDMTLVDGNIPSGLTTDYRLLSGLHTLFVRFHVFRAPGLNEYPNIWGRSVYVSESTNAGWGFYIDASNDGSALSINNAIQANNSSPFYKLRTGLTAADDTRYSVLARRTSSTRQSYANGESTIYANANNLNPDSSNGTVAFGNALGTALIGFIEGAIFTGRDLSLDEIRQLHQFSIVRDIFSGDRSWYINAPGLVSSSLNLSQAITII